MPVPVALCGSCPTLAGEGAQVTVSVASVAQVPATRPLFIMFILTRKILNCFASLAVAQTVLHGAEGMVGN